MSENWNPFVSSSKVSIDADAVSAILKSFERLADHLDVEHVYALICPKGKLKGKGDVVRSLQVIVGTYPKQGVPLEMIGSCGGHTTVFVLNPFFGEVARPVRIKVHGTGIAAFFQNAVGP